MSFDMGSWLGQSIVQKLVDTVYSYLQEQFEWQANIQNALHKLHSALLPIQIAVREAEKVDLDVDQNPELVLWMWQLRDAVEEAADVLDEMEYYRLECQIMRRDAEEAAAVAATTSSKRLKVSNFFKVHGFSASTIIYKLDNYRKRALKMDPTLEKLTAVVDNLKQVNESIHVLKSVVTISPSLWGVGNKNGNDLAARETGYMLTIDEVLGRNKDKEHVIQWLKKSESNSHNSSNICALTIWGIGGVGKTTLAQAIYNDEDLKDHFKIKMWVCVSNNHFDILDIMKQAIQSAKKDPLKSSFMMDLQEELKVIVSFKKCLLILDDVWDDENNQNPQQWESFVGLLSKHADRGSKILITSRTRDVAQLILQCLPFEKDNFRLGCLQENESLSLFKKHAFVGADPAQYINLQSISKRIAKRCGGLPLALKIIGGLLNANLNYSYWVSVLKNDILNLDKGVSNIFKVLKFSYQRLPSNLQLCFRICCLFPQDYKFREDELIALWMAVGFIVQSKNGNTLLEDIGREYLAELVRRSFFIHKYGTYTMHDLLHDLARDVSRGECLRVEGNKPTTLPKTLRHLSTDQWSLNLFKKIATLQKLQTLILSCKSCPIESYDEFNGMLRQLTSLRALSLEVIPMPSLNAIGQLIHLRFFHMHVDILNKPLKPLYKLYHLLSLKCQNLELYIHLSQEIELDGIGNLVNLRYLNVPYAAVIKITGFEHLTKLQMLSLQLSKDNMFRLSDLKNMNKIRHLEIISNCAAISTVEAKAANMDKKEHMESLSLWFLNSEHSDSQLHEQFCNCLQPHPLSNIKSIEIKEYMGMRAPSWMVSDYLPYLTFIKLFYCKNLEHLPPLGQLPSLEILTLHELPSVKQLGTELYGSSEIIGFSSLKGLHIGVFSKLEEWVPAENPILFPSLETLHIVNCSHLKEIPPLPHTLKSLKLYDVGLIALPAWQEKISHEMSKSLNKCVLEKLEIRRCRSMREMPMLPFSLKELFLESVGLVSLPAWQQDNINSPLLETLQISDCEELISFQPFICNCPSLKRLTMEKCPKLLFSNDDYIKFNQPVASSSSSCPNLLDSLTSLSSLHLTGLASMTSLPSIMSFSQLTALKDIKIADCENLSSLGGLHALTCLTSLSIMGCNKLTSSSINMPQQAAFSSNVEVIEIDNVLLLQIGLLMSINSAKSLKVVSDENATCLPHQWMLQNHSSLRELSLFGMHSLHINNCSQLKSLLDKMPSFLVFKINSCPLVHSLEDNLPSSLTKLSVSNCENLESLPDNMPSSLTTLSIGNCEKLKALPDNMPSSLNELEIYNCPLLKSLPNNMPSSLSELKIHDCPLLKSLPNNIPSSLTSLIITSCSLLSEQCRKHVGPCWPKIAHIPRILVH